MGAAYSFVSRWSVPASPERCWAEIERMIAPPAPPGLPAADPTARATASWWPGVTLAEAPAAIAPGEALVLAVRSPLGYRLRARFTITDVEPGRSIGARSDGDLRGAGRLEILPAGEAASLVFHWDVETERAWMNATAFALRPLFARAHERVMARGEQGLLAALARE